MKRTSPTSRPALVLALAAAVASSALASEPVPPSAPPPVEPDWSRSLSLQDLLDLELASPAKLPQTSREAPGQASLVTRQLLREYGWTSIEDVLYRQPGFFPSHEAERNTIGARGLSESWNNNHLLLLIDGVPFNDGESAAAYTSDLTPLFITKDLEIIRGTGSALYGSSATNGVISLNTVSAAKLLGENGALESTSQAALRVGNLGARALDVLTAARTRYLSTVLAFNHSETDGNEYLSPDGSGRADASGALQRFQVQDHHSSNYFFAKLEGLDRFSGLQLEYHLQSWRYETAFGWLYWTPDVRTPHAEERHLVNLRYRAEPRPDLSFEGVAQYQRHRQDLHMRFYPDGALGLYPAGVTEVQIYWTQEAFARTQLAWRVSQQATLLAGIEGAAFLYDGDEAHFANAFLDDAAHGFPPSDATVPLGPTYEPVVGEPVWKLAPYAQLAVQRLLGLPISLTAGLRFDSKFFHYRDLASGERRYKSFEQLSPRLALVFSPLPGLSLKGQASQAFRTPSALELFASHSWAESSNVEVRPEQVTTFELGLDWAVSPRLTWRLNGFNTRYLDDILYASSTNALLNLRSRRVAGVESEALGELPLGDGQSLSGFANFTWVRQLSESTYDASLGSSEGGLTWAPELSAKAGLVYRNGPLTIAAQGIFQGEVRRRGGESADPLFAASRPASVAPWTRFDLNLRWRIAHGLSAALGLRNLFDTAGYLIKGGSFPFDYRIEPRRGYASLELDL